MHVLISVNATWNVWNFRRPLVEALLADGHAVTILAPRDNTVPKLEALGCRVVHLEMNVKGLNPLQDATLFVRLRQMFRNLKPDAIFSFTIKNNIFGAFAAKSLNIPFIPNVTGLGTAFLSGGFLERVAITLYRNAFRALPIVFFQNDDDQALFIGRGIVTSSQARRLRGSGIDLKFFEVSAYPTGHTAPVFLMIARLLKDKGVLEYVDAARRVKLRHIDARFQILGATGLENRSAIDRETVRGWEEEGIIEYLGTVEDVRPVIESAHCVVLPSYREGAPRTLIEAAAMARPIITTDVPGCRDVVDHRITGFLCDVRSGENLAVACEKFIGLTASDRADMGKAGRAKMEIEYDHSLVLASYLCALKEMVPALGNAA